MNTAVTTGLTYSFKVTSRNLIGVSTQSSVLPVIAARIPDAPINLRISSNLSTNIGLSWSNGIYNGGSPVIDYQISYTSNLTNSIPVVITGVLSMPYTPPDL